MKDPHEGRNTNQHSIYFSLVSAVWRDLRDGTHWWRVHSVLRIPTVIFIDCQSSWESSYLGSYVANNALPMQTWSEWRERRGGSATIRKILLHTAVWCDTDMFVSIWYDYFRVLCFWWDETSRYIDTSWHWNFVSCALYSRSWMCSFAVHVEAEAFDITRAKGIGACCTSVA